MGSSLEPPPKVADMSAGTWIKKPQLPMRTSLQSTGAAPEVNLRITQVRKHAKGIYPGFETQGSQLNSSHQYKSFEVQYAHVTTKIKEVMII